ncbi:MAG: hypothetical protein ACKV1O_17435, partial [Saprospiraceae bacterium]
MQVFSSISKVVILLCSIWLSSCTLNKTPQTINENPTSASENAPKQSIVQKIKEYGHLPVSER